MMDHYRSKIPDENNQLKKGLGLSLGIECSKTFQVMLKYK